MADEPVTNGSEAVRRADSCPDRSLGRGRRWGDEDGKARRRNGEGGVRGAASCANSPSVSLRGCATLSHYSSSGRKHTWVREERERLLKGPATTTVRTFEWARGGSVLFRCLGSRCRCTGSYSWRRGVKARRGKTRSAQSPSKGEGGSRAQVGQNATLACTGRARVLHERSGTSEVKGDERRGEGGLRSLDCGWLRMLNHSSFASFECLDTRRRGSNRRRRANERVAVG